MISVAILTRNRLRLLQRCVSSVLPQLGEGDEVVVLDTGSADGSREWLARQSPCVRWLTCDHSTDFASARNALVRACTQPVVLMLDDDTIPAGDLLRRVREAVSSRVASGGPALYGCRYRLPWWWHPSMGWTVGMSGPDTICAVPGVAPATSNLAVRRSALLELPFGETTHAMGQHDMYRGGREDADWWRRARLRGWRVEINPKQIVFHEVPPERFQWRYVINRAIADGRADWERNPNPSRLPDAANEIIFGVLALAGDATCFPSRYRQAAGRAVWIIRQGAFVSAAGSLWPRLFRAVGPGLVSRAKKLAAPAVAATVRALRCPRRVPPAKLTHLVIAAPTYLGDTVLVRYLSDSLATAIPNTRVSVISRFPELFVGSPKNVVPINDRDARLCRATVQGCDYALTPYYHHGSSALWRRDLAPKSATFSSDVGFSRRSDYSLAGLSVDKNFGNHELLNLLSLGNLLCESLSLKKPLFTGFNNDALNQKIREHLQERSAYAVIQVGAGLPTKEWPVHRWITVAQRLWDDLGMPSVVIGEACHREEVSKSAEQTGFKRYLNLCGQTSIIELIALLRGSCIFLGPCSGPKHLAMAIGIPTFTLYGPSEPERWGAFFDRDLHGYICSRLKLCPRETCEHPLNASMLALGVDAVMKAFFAHVDLLSKKRLDFQRFRDCSSKYIYKA
ncbi:MAG: glycosyltransferase [Candidatus Sumerlaeaceae bacterium]|nr:glycosyltransferase [Candidatus Sumerlaeaceae bacterium]